MQFCGFFCGVQPGLDEVQWADEPVADAVATSPGDGVAQRHRPLVFQQDQRGRGSVGDVLEDVPVVDAAQWGEAVRGRLGAGDRSRFRAFFAVLTETDQGPDDSAEFNGLFPAEVAQVNDLHVAGVVLVDGECVDHPDGVALA